MDNLLCVACGALKPPKKFKSVLRPNGVRHYPRVCRACRGLMGGSMKVEDLTASHKDARRRFHQKITPAAESIVDAIFRSARTRDRKKGRENNLTREFIAALIANPCLFCGDTTTRMTLDRINNSVGYLQTNVVPACLRCNLARGTMPYAAWVVVAKGMREAREKGLFGPWTGDWKRRTARPKPYRAPPASMIAAGDPGPQSACVQ